MLQEMERRSNQVAETGNEELRISTNAKLENVRITKLMLEDKILFQVRCFKFKINGHLKDINITD